MHYYVLIINVTVINGKHDIDVNGNDLKIYTSAPRENNKANYDIIKQLAAYYKVDFHKIKLISGGKSRKKIFSIDIQV